MGFLNFSDISLLVYRNETDFYIYPPSLLNSLMSSNSFLIAMLDFLCIVSCHLQTGTVLLFLFQFGFLVLFFLIWLSWLDFQNYTEKQVMRVVISTSAMFLVLFLILEETDFHW